VVSCYDYINDQFFFSSASGHPYAFNPSTLVSTYLLNSYSIWFNGGQLLKFLSVINGVYNSAEASVVYDTITFQTIMSTSDLLVRFGGIEFNNKNGFFYRSGDGSLQVYDKNLFTIAAVTNSGFSRGPVCLVPDLNYIFGGAYNSNTIGVANTSTNTNIGTLSKSSLATNEAGTRTIVFGNYSSRVFAQASNGAGAVTGVDRIHVLNPALALASMNEGYITVGNMYSTANQQKRHPQMCFNQILQ
jgi:hypothetical protein